MPDTSTGRDLLVVFDVSKSMLSDDVKPSRLDHAKWLVREIVKKNPGDRFGLIAFAGESFLVCPLTVDRASFIQLVDDLDVDTIPVGGTNVQLALEEAVRAFQGAQGMHKAVVLVTDGDELTGRGASVVNDLSKAQIPIFAVGVGDPSNPAVIRVPDEDGKLRILTDREGNPVKSPLNEPQLTELARRTGGIYVRSTAAYSGIDELETRIKALDRKESENAVSAFRPIERPAYPLTAAIILLALFFCVSETRPRSAQMILALGASAHLLLCLTLICFKNEDPSRLIKPCAAVVFFVSAFLSGFLPAEFYKRRGLLIGLAGGAALALVFAVLSLILSDHGTVPALARWIGYPAILLLSTFGGLFGGAKRHVRRRRPRA